MTEYRGLPKEYIQLEYIQSVSKQHINTAFNPTSHTKVVIDVELISQSSGSHACIFGSRNAASSTATQSFCVWSMSPGTTIRSDYFGGNKSISHSIIGKRVTITKDGRHCEVDSKVIDNNEKTGSSSYPLCLMGCNTAGVWEYRSPMRLYSCQIYDIERLQRDYVPAKRVSDGAIGLYDVVSKKFFANAGTGVFTAGAEVKTPVAAYVGAPGSVKLDESNLLSYFETDQRNDLDGSQFRLIRYDVLDAGGLQSVELIAKEDTVISFDYKFYRELSNGIFELYINSELIYSFSNTEYTYKNKWSGRVSKNSSLKIELKLNTDITGEVSVRTPPYVECVIFNIQISTPSAPTVARKITNAYIGAPESVQLNSPSSFYAYFVDIQEGKPNREFYGSSYTAYIETTGIELKAKEDFDISFNYYIVNDMLDTGVYMFYINSEFIGIYNAADGIRLSGTWTGKMLKDSVLSIVAIETRMNAVSNVLPRAPERTSGIRCTLTNIQISTPSIPSVARKIKKAYIGVPTQIPIYEEQQVTKDVETLITPSNISNFFTVKDNAYKFVGDSSGKFTSNNKGYNSTSAKSSWIAKKQIKKLTFNYKVSSESGYDEYTITVGGSTVASNISGSGSDKSYSGSLDSGKAIVLRYIKDSSQHKNDDCGTIWNIKVTTTENVTEKVQVGTETKEVARLCYQAPPQ